MASTIAIIVHSFEARECAIVQALDEGADDSIVRPCSPGEVEARIRALLRRMCERGRWPEEQEPEYVQSENRYISLHRLHHLAYAGGKRISFTPLEFTLAWELLFHAGKVLTHQALLQAVWGPAYASEVNYLRVYIRQMRQKIEVDPSQPRSILTEPGVGYVLRNPSP